MTTTADLADLKGRTIFITGAGQGVGRQVALHAAAHGAGAVVINDYFMDRAESVAAEIEALGVRAVAVQADVSDFDSVGAAFATAREAVGPISILVNNAGNAGPNGQAAGPATPYWAQGPKDWSAYLSVNLYGVLNSTRHALEDMVAAGYGRVITVISDAGRVGEPGLEVYSGAKAAAAGFMRGIARSVGRYNVTANSVALAATRTPFVEAIMQDEEMLKAQLKRYIIRRFGEPDDAANMIIFLASDAAGWITAQTIPVNGGYSVSQ